MILAHLIPNARAWRVTTDKALRRLISGLSDTQTSVKAFADDVYSDLLPATTRALDLWEAQFGLTRGALTEDERRARLDATWKGNGGQSPRYIEDTLRAAGFDVYVHEWWVDEEFFPLYGTYSGEVSAECGEVSAECVRANLGVRPPTAVLAPDNALPVDGKGYPLVTATSHAEAVLLPISGELGAQCGEPDIYCYNYLRVDFERRLRETTIDPSKWPYYLYIGGSEFGDIADVSGDRKNELETLILKISPSQQWLGMLINYI